MILRLLEMSLRLVFGEEVVASMAGVARPVGAVGVGASVFEECVVASMTGGAATWSLLLVVVVLWC